LRQRSFALIQPSTQAVTQKKTTYTFAYAYNPSGATSIRPHAPSHIGLRTYSDDADGNQTGWTHDTDGTRRAITWDDENRIQNNADNGQTKDYKYDDKGQRMIKRGPQGETVYVNQFQVASRILCKFDGWLSGSNVRASSKAMRRSIG